MASDNQKRIREEILKLYIEKHFSTSEDLMKWILATIVVIDSGVIFALASSSILQKHLFGWPGLLFGISLLFVFICSFFVATGYVNEASDLTEIIWKDDLGEYDTYESLYNNVQSHKSSYKFGFIFLFLSITAFIGGCILIASSGS